MTEKENYLMTLRGEQPEWLPRFSFGGGRPGVTPLTSMITPKILSTHFGPTSPVVDIWGVTYVAVEEAFGGKLPEPGNFILKDITQWRDVIKTPDISGIDFEAEAQEALDKIDRNETAVVFDLNANFFQLLMSFMGFTEGLLAMFEEPDEVKALYEYVSEWLTQINTRMVNYIKPDIVSLIDDTAAWKSSFISVDMYRDLVKPYHARQVKIGKDIGCLADVHNCGRCEDFIDDWIEMGISAWNPAQTSNDLVGIKKKYGNKMVLCGCWDGSRRLRDPDVTEEEVKRAIYELIDTFAPGGGFMFTAGFMGLPGDTSNEQKNKWVNEVYEEHGKNFYKK